MSRSIAILSLPAFFAMNLAQAHAGNLAATARGIDNKSSSDSKSSSSSDSKSENESSDSSFDDSNYGGCLLCDGEPSSPVQIVLPPPSFDIRLSAQKVFDSDGSFHFDTSMDVGRVGLYTAADHYFEQIHSVDKMAEASDDIRIDLFEIAAFARIADTKVFRADLRVGAAVASSSVFDTLPGGMVGLRLRARANEHLSLSAEARAMRYSHEISAVEAMAGATISYAWLGYRALKFDVGPVLEGPEAGLQFHF